MSKLKNYLNTTLQLDLRALAGMRIVIGLLLAFDSLMRIPNLKAFYSDEGIVTRTDFLSHLEIPYRMSLLFLNGTWSWAFLMASLGVISGLLVTLGYRTRLFSILGWLSLCAFHGRNPMLAHGGDNLLRVTYFWGFFLPLAKVWSVDSQISTAQKTNLSYRSAFSLAFSCQVFFMYIFTSIYKDDPAWLSRFDALYFAAHLDSFVTPIGALLQNQIVLCKMLTFMAIALEALGPILIIFPYKQNVFRSIGVALFIALHLGIALTFNVGIFSIACVAIWIPFIPATFWNLFSTKKIEGFFTNFRKLLPKSPSHPEFLANKSSSWHKIVASGLTLLVFAWNLEGIKLIRGFDLKSPFTDIVFALQLNQQWNMFAPSPMKNDGWFILEAELRDGRKVDVLHPEKPLSEIKPLRMANMYQDSQWRKFLLNLRDSEHEYFRGRLGNYFCNEWNHKNRENMGVDSDKAIKVNLVFMQERTLDPEQVNDQKIERVDLWTKICD